MDRREFLKNTLRLAGMAVIAGGAGHLALRQGKCVGSGACASCGLVGTCAEGDAAAYRAKVPTLWQIDPYKCIQCGKCATNCVLKPSAVKCFHAYAVCGYCDLCTGFFEAQPNALTTAAENQLCPTAAIKRKYVEDPYFQYSIDRDLCIGCSKCVKGCTQFGNGSLYLQINQDICVKCNECSIAVNCPSKAISRTPAIMPYLQKSKTRTS